MNFIKVLFIVLGTLSLCTGIIGIVVPGLPTTPFVLLSAGLYLKSSDKLYQKLITNRFVGLYIVEFQTKKGMTKKTKLIAIATMWVMIIISSIFFITPLSLKLILITFGLIGTLVMGFIVTTTSNSNRYSYLTINFNRKLFTNIIHKEYGKRFEKNKQMSRNRSSKQA